MNASKDMDVLLISDYLDIPPRNYSLHWAMLYRRTFELLYAIKIHKMLIHITIMKGCNSLICNVILDELAVVEQWIYPKNITRVIETMNLTKEDKMKETYHHHYSKIPLYEEK